jgi:hypothetical protein
MINRENIFMTSIWIGLFLVYGMFLWNISTIQELVIISFVGMSFFKSIYDVKYRTGYAKMYSFKDEELNQYLRYIVVVITSLMMILYNYIYFVKMLKIF